jgi:hypothetical protein
MMDIVREGNHLFAQILRQKYEILPESVRDCFFNAFDAQITFVTTATAGRRN